jgi:hypothetical protein
LRRLRRRRPGIIESVGCGAARVAGSKIAGIGRRHYRHIRHRLWLKLDDARLDLSIDAPQKRTDIEIEHRAIGIHHATGLGPRGKRVERALL